MNYELILKHLGLIESVDFTLTSTSFRMKSKTRMISNPENVTEMIEESYSEPRPTTEQLEIAQKELQIAEVGYAEIIAEYLKGKESLRDENDSFNIANNRLHSFSFSNIPAPTLDQMIALIPSIEAKKSNDDILAEILELEAQITPRKIREAMLSDDYIFIQTIENQIKALREQI